MSQLVKTESNEILKFNGFEEALKAAHAIAQSNLVPQVYRNKPADIIVCWQYGAELGLAPLQSLQSIAVIQGKPGLYGDGLLAVAQSHPDFQDMVETFDESLIAATCIVKRKDREDTISTFSMEDAQRAGLWGKRGRSGQPTPWVTYPKRMLAMRARGFALRDAFSDALRGFKTVEELRDYPDAEIKVLPEEDVQHLPVEEPQTPPDSPVAEVQDIPEEPTFEMENLLCDIHDAKDMVELMQCRPNGSLTEQEQSQARKAWLDKKSALQAGASTNRKITDMLKGQENEIG